MYWIITIRCTCTLYVGDVGRSLGVHLINEGITVSGRCAHVQFRGCGEIDHFRCKLDGGSYEQCEFISILKRSKIITYKIVLPHNVRS